MVEPHPATPTSENLALEQIKHSYQIELEQIRARNAMQLEMKKAEWVMQVEHHKLEYLHWLEDFKRRYLVKQKQAETGTGLANMAMRNLFLINGGAVIGLMTFLGNLWPKDNKVASALAHSTIDAFVMFVSGLILIILATALSYFNQKVWLAGAPEEGARNSARRLRNLAVVLCFCSLGTFIAGAYLAIQAFATA